MGLLAPLRPAFGASTLPLGSALATAVHAVHVWYAESYVWNPSAQVALVQSASEPPLHSEHVPVVDTSLMVMLLHG